MVRLFRSSIKPVPEDEENVNGGKWVVSCKDPDQLRSAWFELVLAVVGGYLPRPELVVPTSLSLFRLSPFCSLRSCVVLWLVWLRLGAETRPRDPDMAAC